MVYKINKMYLKKLKYKINEMYLKKYIIYIIIVKC